MPKHWLLCVWTLAAAYALADEAVTTEENAAATDESAEASDEAAAASKPASSRIEEIVVEGERPNTTLKDTAHSVVVFTDEQLKLGTARNMVDLFQRVPNVTMDPFNRTPTIRGVAANGINRGVTWLPNDLSIVDGYFTPSPSNLWDARQVEVQRGPENFTSGGGMSGLNATTTNEPDEQRGGRADMEWAPDANDRSLGVAYGGPLTEQLGYRFSAYGRSTDGFTSNPTRNDDDWNSSDESLARLKLVWQPFGDADTVARFRFEHHKISIDGSNVAVTGDPDFDPFERKDFSDAVGRDQDETRSVYGELDQRFNDRFHMDSYATLIRRHERREWDSDGTERPGANVRQQADSDFAGVQIRAFYDDGPWQTYFRQYLFYLDYTNARTDILVPLDGNEPPTVARLRFHYSTPDWWFIGTQVGVRRTFGRWSAGASLLRSGQVLHANRGVVSSRINSSGDPDLDAIYDSILEGFFPQADASGDLNDFNYLPTVDVDYAVNDDFTVGAKYERSARGAGVWFNTARALANTFDDEISDSYDVFVRSSAFDGRLNVRANLFYTRITGQQVYVALSSTPDDAEMVNGQRSHNQGLEIETNWIDGGLNAWVSVGLLETRFDRMDVGDFDVSGNEFADAPSWTVSLGFTYVHPSGLFASTDATMRPRTRGDAENNHWVVNEGRTVVNARLGWAFRKVEVSLYARNLLDEEYLAYHDSNPNPGALQTYVPGDPRELGMTVSVEL